MTIEKNVPLMIGLSEVGPWTKKCNPRNRPVKAIICNGAVVIDFSYPVTSLVVTLTAVPTNKVLCWEVYEMVGNVVINMLTEATGNYQLRLTSPQWCLCGNFAI